MIVCVLLPRFPLAVAAGGREALAAGPVALAPEPGREPLIGEVSAAAEAKGVRPGLRLGEALARCPTLRLVPPDPAGVADAWEEVLMRLESIGAGVEPGAPGVAWFASDGLRRLHGGDLEGVLAATRRALGVPARIGAAPSRFAALAAAKRARARRPEIVPARRTPWPPIWRRSRSRCWACGRRPPICPSRSSASASARSGAWPGCRPPRWPTASAPPGRSRASSRWGTTRRCARATRPSGSRRRWSCRSRRRARSSSALWAC